ncbi:hypothetical protein OpiT1DRAFT_00826 [Opitutaceae bacterium TAV1]|nr:hypothetical protein OpiT1DRAFT_00826 [Opitutaceae bacterium TAV1]
MNTHTNTPSTANHPPGVTAALDDLHRDLAKVLSDGSGSRSGAGVPPAGRGVACDAPTCDAPPPPFTLRVTLDPALPSETFRIRITDTPAASPAPVPVAISGADELGAIYGIYEFSHRFLGVDPLWFWKDIEPAPLTPADLRARLAASPPTILSAPPAFRYRGWFVNDEDLLSTWEEMTNDELRMPNDYPVASGTTSDHASCVMRHSSLAKRSRQRFRDWPRRAEFEERSLDDEEANYETRLLQYYTPVAAPEVMERVFEALLRLRGNLVIPSSFNDITNPPEAALVRAAIRRGLHVSQHHVEPLGVSHFAYETWCAKNNHRGAPFSYREAPDVMRACWHDHARRWLDIAGDRVIWQIGLRGRGDRPLWSHDPAARTHAGEFIAAALADQLAIIRETDSRPAPPVTLTLWLEGAELVSNGQLQIPPGVTCVFADHHLTQELQDDFTVLPRDPQNPCGVYYHAAVWPFGPHLVQGPPPAKIARIVRQLIERGDTRYAILNVSNIREHVMAAQCFMEQVGGFSIFDWGATAPAGSSIVPDENNSLPNQKSTIGNPKSKIPLTEASFLARWSPPGFAPLHAKLLAAIPEISPGFRLYDGAARRFIYNEVHALATATPPRRDLLPPGLLAILDTAAQNLAALLGELRARAPQIDPRHASFFQTNLVAQTTLLLGLYRTLAALLRPAEPDFAAAAAGLRFALDAFPVGETGRWRGWYRGDTKMALAHLLNRIESSATSSLSA